MPFRFCYYLCWADSKITITRCIPYWFHLWPRLLLNKVIGHARTPIQSNCSMNSPTRNRRHCRLYVSLSCTNQCLVPVNCDITISKTHISSITYPACLHAQVRYMYAAIACKYWSRDAFIIRLRDMPQTNTMQCQPRTLHHLRIFIKHPILKRKWTLMYLFCCIIPGYNITPEANSVNARLLVY